MALIPFNGFKLKDGNLMIIYHHWDKPNATNQTVEV